MQERGNEIEHLPAFIIHTAYEHETVCLGLLFLFRLFLFYVLCVAACLTLYTVFSPILIVFSSSISMFMQPICTLPLHVCYFGYYFLDSTIQAPLRAVNRLLYCGQAVNWLSAPNTSIYGFWRDQQGVGNQGWYHTTFHIWLCHVALYQQTSQKIMGNNLAARTSIHAARSMQHLHKENRGMHMFEHS